MPLGRPQGYSKWKSVDQRRRRHRLDRNITTMTHAFRLYALDHCCPHECFSDGTKNNAGSIQKLRLPAATSLVFVSHLRIDRTNEFTCYLNTFSMIDATSRGYQQLTSLNQTINRGMIDRAPYPQSALSGGLLLDG